MSPIPNRKEFEPDPDIICASLRAIEGLVENQNQIQPLAKSISFANLPLVEVGQGYVLPRSLPEPKDIIPATTPLLRYLQTVGIYKPFEINVRFNPEKRVVNLEWTELGEELEVYVGKSSCSRGCQPINGKIEPGNYRLTLEQRAIIGGLMMLKNEEVALACERGILIGSLGSEDQNRVETTAFLGKAFEASGFNPGRFYLIDGANFGKFQKLVRVEEINPLAIIR